MAFMEPKSKFFFNLYLAKDGEKTVGNAFSSKQFAEMQNLRTVGYIKLGVFEVMLTAEEVRKWNG